MFTDVNVNHRLVYNLLLIISNKRGTFYVTVVAVIDCNFELDFCDWEQDALDDFNWKRGVYNIYVNPYNKFQGEIARLMSTMQSPGEYCLTFWYSMYGSDIGTFNVYIVMNDGNKTVIFTKINGMAVFDWWKTHLNIKAYDSFQIVFEGIIGDGNSGYIAIAYIHIRSGSCSIDCDFDDDFCNWMQFDGDDFNWDRGNGSASYSYTGPYVDKSGNGHYIYIDTSVKNSHDTAILLSPLQDAGKYCLSFWYYMYGDGIDRLRVQIWNTNGSERGTMYTLESAQGQQWFQKIIFVHSVDVFQISFEGRVKDARNRFWGDIAIDDVTMVSCQDCTDLKIANAVTNSSNYEYGSVVKIQCNNGYNLVGDSEIICQTMGNWSGTASCTRHVSDDETNSKPLIAMYVLIPVFFVMIAATFTVLYMRRRHLRCMKVLKTFRRAREVPSGDSLQGGSHSNQMYSNEDLQLDDEYATISGEQTEDKNLGTVYYATIDRSGKKKPGVSKEDNQTKSTDYNKSACSIDLNECNTYNVLSAKALNKNFKGGEEHDFDYDSACTRQMKNEASNHDDYSHIGDLEMKYQHTQHFLPQPDKEKNTDYSNIDRVSTSTKLPERLKDYDEYQNPVLKEKKVLEKHTPKIKQIEDPAPDYNNIAQTKEIYESNESENQRSESENHDYFILEKT